jgi:hypothetical protein
MSFAIGNKCWTPNSKDFGQGTVVEVGAEDNVKVAHFWGNMQKWYDVTDITLTPTKEQREAQCSLTFRANHFHDFNPCAANVQMMTDYIRGQEWLWNVESLERAFRALQSKLAPVAAVEPKPVTAAVVASTTQPAVPAATSAITPAVPAVPQLTKREIASWSREEMREKMQDPEIVKQMEALGIRVLKTLGDATQGRTTRKF